MIHADTNWLGEWIYAHRGLHDGHIPENSMPAFMAAVEAGFGIECDVQLSADGEAMVFHDWTLDRMTDASGELIRHDALELERMPIGENGGRIVRLSAMLEAIAGRVPILIEVKTRRGSDWRALGRAVARSLQSFRGLAAVMSFDPRFVHWASRAMGNRPRGLVSGRAAWKEDGPAFAFSAQRAVAMAHARPDFLAVDVRDLPDRTVAARRRRGMPILCWTVRDAHARACAARYCDAPIAEGAGLR